MSIDEANTEKTQFYIFLNPIWLQNHVTYQLLRNKLVCPWLGDHLCEISLDLSSRSGEEDIYRLQGKSNMAAKLCDR